MKLVNLRVVERPESFDGKGFSEIEWRAANRNGDIRGIPYAAAMENIRLSRGLYEIRPEVKQIQAELVGPKHPGDMTAEELAGEMAMWGKPLRGKKVPRKVIVETILKMRAEAANLISDDDE